MGRHIHYNSEQAQVLNANQKSIGILGGPGTGKTVLLSQLLADNVSPKDASKILGFTSHPKFSTIISQDLAKLGYPNIDFHIHPMRLFCLSMLQINQSKLNRKLTTIISPDDQKTILLEILKTQNLKENTDIILECIQHTKRYSPGIEEIFKYMSPNISYMMECYETYMKEHELIDVDDITYLTLSLLRKHPKLLEPFRGYTMFLENAEDATMAQLTAFKMISKHAARTIITADPTQPLLLYDNQFSDHLKQTFETIKLFSLTRNYQCSGSLVQALNETCVTTTKVTTKNKKGESISYFRAYDEMEEVRYIIQEIESMTQNSDMTYDDFMVIYRHPCQLRLLEKSFKNSAVPYTFSCNLKRNYMPKIKTVMNILRYAINQHDRLAKSHLDKAGIDCQSIPELSKKDPFKKAIKFLESKDILLTNLGKKDLFSYLKSLDFEGSIQDFLTHTVMYALPHNKKNCVRIVSAEEAKGFVEKCVFICGMEDGIFPHFDAHTKQPAYRKEKQLFYTAIACARTHLFLTSASQRRILDREWYNDESEFLGLLSDVARFKSERSSQLDKSKNKTTNFQIIQLNQPSLAKPKLNLKQGLIFEHPTFGTGKIKSFTGEFKKRIALVSFGNQEKHIAEDFIIGQILE